MDFALPAWVFRAAVFWNAVWAIWGMFDVQYGDSYVFCNFLVILLGLWSLANRNDVEPIFQYIFFLFFSIIVDSASLGAYVTKPMLNDTYTYSDNFKFSFASALILLITKPLILFVAWREYTTRSTGSGATEDQASSYHRVDDSAKYGTQPTYEAPIHTAGAESGSGGYQSV